MNPYAVFLIYLVAILGFVAFTLLLNRVQRVLHESVKGAAGKFPVVQGVAGQAMSVKEFLEFMQKVGGFQSAFAELSRRLDEGSDTRQCIDRVEARRKVEDLSRLKDEFLSIASHELRTPVTSIKGYTQLAKMLINEGDLITSEEYLDIALDQIDQLERHAQALDQDLGAVKVVHRHVVAIHALAPALRVADQFHRAAVQFGDAPAGVVVAVDLAEGGLWADRVGAAVGRRPVVLELVDPADVDERFRLGEPQLHERQQAHPARDDLRRAVRCGERFDGLVERGDPPIGERCRDHAWPPFADWIADQTFCEVYGMSR